jgi:predicted ATPase
LFVGTYRSDDISSEQEMKIQHYSNGGKIQLINLHNLDMGNVNQLISSLLRMEKSKTESLAKIIFSKSAGNPHYTLEILKTIEKQKLIHFSLIHFGWEWDTEIIKSSVNVGDNIVDKIVSRMATLPVHVLNALTFGLCFGTKFDTAILQSVIIKLFLTHDPPFISHTFLMNLLEYALEEGIVLRHTGSSFYRFAHDKIHQALYSLIPQLRRPDTLHLKIGRILLELRQQNEDIGLTFLAAGQFNYSLHLIECPIEAVEIAKLYLFAAKESIHLSAYGPAAEYLRHRLYSIRDQRWLQYDTQLELLVCQAKVELCLGHFQNCRTAAEEIIQNANTLEEKTPAFQACVDSYGAEGMMDMCIQEGLGSVKLWE